jgi:ribonuclease HI
MKYHAYLFVDGSSSRGDDIGAWAAVAVTASTRRLLYGVDFPTTISRCELRPIIEGLRWMKTNWALGSGYRICVCSDSEYTVKTLSGLYPRNKNKELWEALDEAVSDMQVHYVWRERNTLPYMTLCDGICGALRRRQIDYMKTVASDPRNPETDMPVYELPDMEVEAYNQNNYNGNTI